MLLFGTSSVRAVPLQLAASLLLCTIVNRTAAAALIGHALLVTTRGLTLTLNHRTQEAEKARNMLQQQLLNTERQLAAVGDQVTHKAQEVESFQQRLHMKEQEVQQLQQEVSSRGSEVAMAQHMLQSE